LLGAATVAALLIPGAAGAAPAGAHPASREPKPEVTESFKAPGTNGFTLNVTLLEHKRLVVTAEAKVGRQGSKEALYTLSAPQSPGSDGIKARIGGLGKIDVHFVAESTKKAQPNLPGCTGGETVVETGHFVGEISFRGEQGFTRVGASRAVGSVISETAPKCKNLPSSPREGTGSEKKAAEAIAEAEGKEVDLNVVTGHGKVRLVASRSEVDAKGKSRTFANFTAVAGRSRGKVQEISLVLLLLQKGPTFLSPEPSFPTRAATVAPPAPFSGSAAFAREPGKPASWSGDLKVELPGFGEVPLADSGSKASMCQGPACGGL
jgi:hypothetical protein